MSDENPPLGPGPSDHIVPVLRMLAGAVPVVGSALNELITQVIPGVRQKRVEDYLRYLSEKLSGLSEEQLKQRLLSEPGLDLFEEGGYQTARALSDERREQIATAVAEGLSGDEQNLLAAKRMLILLRELDEGQVIVLTSQLRRYRDDSEFMQRHANILTPVRAHLQSTRDELDAQTVQQIATQKLVSLGLLQPGFKKVKKGDIPEIDPKTGMLSASGVDITPLGRLLLRTIGLASPDDY
ncbi:hypothetical protein [Pseudodonghicola flavimaris]|uniref:DUF4393 domain-containing protein n=1 Tax=Pseudodonghicola flavimaris TaxID=3050036 RepID=A0ABT7F8M5_9RHOB|nr:hypothetical protein [Pseudodonghicola flavimaris]MDK3020955.1 hypothetical protein [Pseudodonghicola flavimaris]